MLTVDEVDRALARLGADSDRIAEALVAMDNRTGHQLLNTGALTGVTEQRWGVASLALSALWDDFSSHRTLLEQARQLRDRRSRLGEDELTELSTLVTKLGALSGSMDAACTMVTDLVDAVEAAWRDAVDRLDPLDRELRAARALAGELGIEELELGRIAGELAEIRGRTAADPLAAPAPGRELTDRIAAVRTELTALAAARDSLAEQLAGLGTLIDEIAEVRDQIRDAHVTVLEKIASPGLPPLTDPVPALRTRLDGLPVMSGRLRELAAALDGLRGDANNALADVRARLDAATGLLDRRLELRGRLDAYHAKARHLGYAEDLDLLAVHREARVLLYTVPCDLAASTRAVKRYQEALQARREAR
jgi:DNA repair exonuclease SbcCD ATPase subunit